MKLRGRTEIPNGADRFCSLDASRGAKGAPSASGYCSSVIEARRHANTHVKRISDMPIFVRIFSEVT